MVLPPFFCYAAFLATVKIMQNLFSAEYQWLWTLLLGGALFLPVRQLIWALSVRRADARGDNVDEAESLRLKRRAAVTAGLLCFLFSLLYVNHMLKG
jgi:hypothetical protein